MSSNLPRMVPFRTCSPLSEGLMGGRWRCWAHVLRSVEAVLSGVGAASRGLRKGAIGPRSSEDSTATLGSPAGSPGARHSVCSRKSRCVVLRISSGLRRRSRRSRLSLRESKSDVALLRPPVDRVQVAAVSRARSSCDRIGHLPQSGIRRRFSDRSEESSDPPGTPPSAATAPLARVHFNFLRVNTF